MWALSEVREKVYNFQKLPLDKSHFITEVKMNVFQKSDIYSHICHGFPIATRYYNLLSDFSSLVFALMRWRGKHKHK